MVKIFGFTLIRNGIKYDYPFVESLISLGGVSEKIYLAVGKSEDGTEALVQKLPKIKVLNTVWDDSLRAGGIILSQQTNVALDELRKEQGALPGAWGFYLQGDEVIHEDDYSTIIQDIERAEKEGADAVAFRYLHFWQSHKKIAINKKWYPQEIRAIKLSSSLTSWGDAQSFRPTNKIFYSDARIFHYGHVRESASYANKKRDILRLYHLDNKLNKYRRREMRFDSQTEVLTYFGSHPMVMRERILKLEKFWKPDERSEVFIVGEKNNINSSVFLNLAAKKVSWFQSIFDVPFSARKMAIVLNPSLLTSLYLMLVHWVWPFSSVPRKMRSKLALPWPEDFYWTLRLSEKSIAMKVND